MSNDQEKPTECDACQFETADLERFDDRLAKPERRIAWLCSLCAGTMSGNAWRFPGSHEHAEILHTVCYVGNAILEAIRKRQEP